MTRCGVVVFAVFSPAAASAQATAADGVQALIRGDYATAIRVLRPLAEEIPQPDPVAQFFMAMLYQSGNGVTPRPFLACSLYRAAAVPANPLMHQARELSRATLDKIRDLAETACPLPGAAIFGPKRDPAITSGATPLDTATAAPPGSTADGVAALLAADNVRAAEILRPMAEQRLPLNDRDHVAEFFMATLYESGRGVSRDPIRACALYMRAGFEPHNPFSGAAERLILRLQESMSRDAFAECGWLANNGLDIHFEPVTFVLDRDHSLSWDPKGVTIFYRGGEKRIANPVPVRDAVFLPLQHTELTVGRPRSMRRHFIEVAFWLPRNDGRWMLQWFLFEVVRDDLVRVAANTLVEAQAGDSRVAPPFDLRQVVALGVNGDGNPEWTIRQSGKTRTELIESLEERAEKAERMLALKTALARDDLPRVGDVGRAPALTYVDATGCRDIFVYGWSANQLEAITVWASKDALRLSTKPRTFDLAKPPAGFEAIVYVFERRQDPSTFCTDAPQYGPHAMWRITRGKITIELSAPGVRVREPLAYRATVRIEGSEFVSGFGDRVQQSGPIVLTAIVGRRAGRAPRF